jgi:hypothetical protein
VTTLTLNGGSGNNVYNVVSTAPGTATTINSRTGADTFNIGAPGAGSLDLLLGPVAFNDLGGPLALNFNDQLRLGGATYILSSTSLTRGAFAFVFAGVTTLTLNTGSGPDSVEVRSTPAGRTTTVNTGGGNDTVRIGGPVGGLSDIAGPLAVNGGTGNLGLIFDDQASTADHDYLITATTVSRTGFSFTYANIQSLTLLAGSGNDTVRLQNTPAATAVTVDGGAGNDILVGDGNANTLIGGDGRNILIGGGGADSLQGGKDDDILIDGTTNYDNDLTALAALMSEWSRGDADYARRVDHLQNGGGQNGDTLLNSKTTQGDGAADTLTGGAGLDLFRAGKEDTTDLDSGAGEVNLA